MKQKRRVTTSLDVKASLPSRVSMDRKVRQRAGPAATIVPSAPAAVSAPAPSIADVDLSVDLGRGLVLRNPILVASGTFGYGV